MGFKKTTFAGYDNKELDKFYQQQVNKAKKMGYTDQKAQDFAAMMVEMYGHQFRSYK